MNIKPSAEIRNNYNKIANICRETGEPVYLTRNGEGDLVVMDIDSFEKREKILRLREELIEVKEDRAAGKRDFTLEEVKEELDKVIEEAVKKKI